MDSCVTCRQSKVRCSGLYPCDHCERRALECIFNDEGRRVTVSERWVILVRSMYCVLLTSSFRYLRHLQKLAQRSGQDKATQAAGPSEPDVTEGPDGSRNILQCPALADGVEEHLRTAHETQNALFIDQPPNHACESWLTPFTLPSMTIPNNQDTARGWSRFRSMLI